MIEKVKRFAQLCSYLAMSGFSLFGLLTLLGAGSIASVNAGLDALTNQGTAQLVANTAVPTSFNYQGTLRDSDGNIIETGEYTLTFKIYADIGTANSLFDQTKEGVIVRNGRFSVTLTDIPNTVFTGAPDRFIGVTVEPFAEMVPRERLSSVPYAVQADLASEATYGAIPIGGVVDWFPPQADSPLPAGYALCDGSVVEGVQLPDLNGRFTYGTTDLNAVGTSGGSETHTHTLSVPEHTHTYDISHDHAQFTTVTDQIPPAAYFGFAAGNEPGASEAAAYWHQHNVLVDVPAYSESPRITENVQGDDFESHASSSLPPYVQLLKICRYQ
ncbi:MAG: hypothetical protein AAF614_16040 [Chloroflexota bacterium]